MTKAPPTPKGFRDIAPELAKRRRETIGKIVRTLEEFGFVPIETPTIEFAETLEGKYGEEERLIYKFTDRGGRKLALRYDLTVPLARFVASNLSLIAKGPFRRYQIGQVFRGENPQKGRFREFTQFDFDTVGSSDPAEDAKVVAVAIRCMQELKLEGAIMLINDRANFQDFKVEVIRAIDKINKIGEEAVLQELVSSGLSQQKAKESISKIKSQKLTSNLEEIFKILKEEYQLIEGKEFAFDPSLARGLDYYTGMIIEAEIKGYGGGSIGGGGRYDNLIGMFAKKAIPAVGFSFGLDRMLEILYP